MKDRQAELVKALIDVSKVNGYVITPSDARKQVALLNWSYWKKGWTPDTNSNVYLQGSEIIYKVRVQEGREVVLMDQRTKHFYVVDILEIRQFPLEE